MWKRCSTSVGNVLFSFRLSFVWLFMALMISIVLCLRSVCALSAHANITRSIFVLYSLQPLWWAEPTSMHSCLQMSRCCCKYCNATRRHFLLVNTQSTTSFRAASVHMHKFHFILLCSVNTTLHYTHD
jgi:hypothetical protein